MYILNAICNRFYFEEVQEEVLGQCSVEGILAPRKKKVYLSISGLFQLKTSRVVEEIPL